MGEKATPRGFPMPEKSQPELEESSELDDEGQSKYQSLIGCLQWVVTLGRFDIAVAVMTMSRFRVAPRQGHLDLLGHIFGYLRKYLDGAIRFCTETPPHEEHFYPSKATWDRSVYGEPHEDIPENAPSPKGKTVRQSTMFDANLENCKVTGRSAMGVIFMVQGTIVGHFSRRQSTVETATYASEFIAGRAALDESIAIRYELRMLGVPLDGPIWMFGDNKSMIGSLAEPSGQLTKRHLILSWHWLREKAAMGVVYYLHISSKENLADCLTKHLTHAPLWALVKDHLFHHFQKNDDVMVMHGLLRCKVALDGECQARNGFYQEHDVYNHDRHCFLTRIGNDYHLVQGCIVNEPTTAQPVFWSRMTRWPRYRNSIPQMQPE
jgi:hypothetical protein